MWTPCCRLIIISIHVTRSLMWSDQTLMTNIPSSASGYTESGGGHKMRSGHVHVGICVSVRSGVYICLTRICEPEKVR